MLTTVKVVRNDDATLQSTAHTLRTVQGVLSVDVDEAASALHVRHDADVISEGEILNLIGMEGVAVDDVEDEAVRRPSTDAG